jgi:WD40 repeat protein
MIKGTSAKWGTCSCTVLLDSCTLALSYWNNTIAVGCGDRNIIILDAITGSQVAILSGHTGWVRSVAFSSDGRSLVSGSYDANVKLWDVETGGVAKTFYGHTEFVWSVAISADCTRIASGSEDEIIYLWDVHTEKHLYTIKQQQTIFHVSFSPIDPQQIISISGSKVWHWDINGHQVPPTYDGTHVAFSPDHTQLHQGNTPITLKVLNVPVSDRKCSEVHFPKLSVCFTEVKGP